MPSLRPLQATFALSANDAPAGDPERAVEAARQWNRDLRHTVRTAKGHALAMSDNSQAGVHDTPRRPN